MNNVEITKRLHEVSKYFSIFSILSGTILLTKNIVVHGSIAIDSYPAEFATIFTIFVLFAIVMRYTSAIYTMVYAFVLGTVATISYLLLFLINPSNSHGALLFMTIFAFQFVIFFAERDDRKAVERKTSEDKNITIEKTKRSLKGNKRKNTLLKSSI